MLTVTIAIGIDTPFSVAPIKTFLIIIAPLWGT